MIFKKRLIMLIYVFNLLIFSNGCAINSPKTYQKSPETNQALCNELKRQAVFNASNRNIEATYTTLAQKQAFANKLKAANCGPY